MAHWHFLIRLKSPVRAGKSGPKEQFKKLLNFKGFLRLRSAWSIRIEPYNNLSKIITFIMVKKLIAVFLLLQIISNNAFAEELIKLPRLFTHYYHHAKEHQDTKDFFDFLHKHYSDHHENDAHSKKHSDEDKDCNLPFKHCGGCCVNIHAPAIGFVSSYLTADYNLVLIKSSEYISENDRIESSDLCSIWQPPKSVN